MSTFPHILSDEFSEREKILHSLTEATIMSKFDDFYIREMLTCLANYERNHGSDLVLEILFIKYLKRYTASVRNKPVIFEESISQYRIAFDYFGSKSKMSIDKMKDTFSNTNVSIDNIPVSMYLAYEIFKYEYKQLYIYFPVEIKTAQFFESSNAFCNIWNNDILDNLEEIFPKLDRYFPLQFWSTIAINRKYKNLIRNIEVNNNSYLFHASACLSYYNRFVTSIYNVENLKLPSDITIEIIQLTKYKLPYMELLTCNLRSEEIMNLCSLVYLLVLDNATFANLSEICKHLNKKSYLIILLVYSMYTSENLTEEYGTIIYDAIDIKDSRNFIFVKKYFSIMAKAQTQFKFDLNDLLYVAPECIDIYQIPEISFTRSRNAFNSVLKRKLCRVDFDLSKFDEYMSIKDVSEFYCLLLCKVSNNEEQIKRSMQAMISINFNIVKKCLNQMLSDKRENILKEILLHLEIPKEIIESNKQLFLDSIELISHYYLDSAAILYKRYGLVNCLNLILKEKLFIREGARVELNVSHHNIIENSMKALNGKDLKNKSIRIKYSSENGSDCGGLGRDWFTNVSKDLISSEYFIPTPNGTTLMINSSKVNPEIYHFAGQLIGLSISSRKLINLKLTTSLWKLLMNEPIELNDVKDYDSQIHKSLTWILENDPDILMMSFVNDMGKELCENGENITLEQSNKSQYVSLYIEDLLHKRYADQIAQMICGFHEAIDPNRIDVFNANEIYLLTNGVQKLNLEDWKANTSFAGNKCSNSVDLFFSAISKWDEEKQRRLLQFITGSSQIPIGGFQSYINYGGRLTIEFGESSSRLPCAATCFNKIRIPAYDSEKLFDQKLSIALECIEFDNF